MSVENTHFGALGIAEALKNCKKIFFIGIGGISMSALARISLLCGYGVGGSDRGEGALIESLKAMGMEIFSGHDARHLCGYDAVVYTVAIGEDNPEYLAAKERGLPLFSRSDYLNFLMTGYRVRVGVAGMHGKSTCTSICAQILLDADVDPTILSGASYAPRGGAYRLGDSKEHFLFEACEYMDSFLDFNPTVAILLGAELEHVDYFKSMEQIIGSFARFAALTGPDGVTVVNADDKNILESANRALLRGETGRVITFSASGREDADLYARNPRLEGGFPCFELVAYGQIRGTVAMAVPGRFQIINGLAAAAAMEACGIPWEFILSGLSHYIGAGRRMERRGEVNGAVVYDDYGHHPTEVKATLEGAKALCAARSSEGRLICVFQPHTYSRTANLYPLFLNAFDAADAVLLLDIYAAREQNEYGVSSRQLAEDLNGAVPDKARYCSSAEDAAALIRALAREGDSVVIMGAGDVTKVTAALLG